MEHLLEAQKNVKRIMAEYNWISDDEDTCQTQPYRPVRKKVCTARDEMLSPLTRPYQVKPSLHWKPLSTPSLSSIREDESEDRKFFKTSKTTKVREVPSRQPLIRTKPSVRSLCQESTSSISRKIIPPKLSNRTIPKTTKSVSSGVWPRNCLGGSNYSDRNKKPLSTYSKWKPTTAAESIRIEEKQQYLQLLQHCTLSQSPLALSPTRGVCQVSSSSSNSSSPVMHDTRWSRNSSMQSVHSDAGSENASPIFLSSSRLSRPLDKGKSTMKKEDLEHHKRPATNYKSAPSKIPLSDITMRKEFSNSRVKRNERSESVIRSVGLCADDEEELSLGQLVRQQHHKAEAPKDAIPVIDLCQSDSDSIESVKESESDSIEIVDEFPHTRRTDLLKDLYDGKWMEAKQGELSSIDLKAKSADVEDEQLQSKRKNQVDVFHEKVERRFKQLDIVCAMPEERRLSKLSVKKQAFTPLTPEMQDEVKAALVPYPKSEVLIHKFNIKITRRDIATLNSPNWLNDEVINFYMNLIMDRSMKNKRLPKVYVFSTFFYPKLCQSDHKSVSRWTKKVDIFTYDILLIPIHLDVHWCMATVDFRKRCISYYDSMLGDNPECSKLLLEYLEAEYLDKKKASYNTAAWKLECPKNIPEQMNGSDCGMFSCKFAEFKSRLSPLNFTQEDMPYFRQRMVYEILKGKLLEG